MKSQKPQEHLRPNSNFGYGFFDRVVETLNQLGSPKHEEQLNMQENEPETGYRTNMTLSLSRSGKFKRSLKKAKRLLDGGRGLSPKMQRKQTEAFDDSPRFLSLFSRSYQNSQNGGIQRLPNDNASLGKENAPNLETCQGTKRADDTLKREEGCNANVGSSASKTVAHNALQPLPVILSDYMTSEEIKAGAFHVTAGTVKSHPLRTPQKTVFTTLTLEVLKENQRWIKTFEEVQGTQGKAALNTEFLKFLETVQNLLKFESGFIEEMHLRSENICLENTILRKELINAGVIQGDLNKRALRRRNSF